MVFTLSCRGASAVHAERGPAGDVHLLVRRLGPPAVHQNLAVSAWAPRPLVEGHAPAPDSGGQPLLIEPADPAAYDAVAEGYAAEVDLAGPLPFAGGAFDDIVASLVLHHLRYWGPAPAAPRRVLTSGGRLLASWARSRCTTSPGRRFCTRPRCSSPTAV